MNPFEMVVLIVLIVGVSSVLKAWAEGRRRQRGGGQDNAENLRLREEVVQLKERLKVLERITVEKENSLSRQIEELRDER